IDRLSKRAHAFHRFAHHPLCQPYRDEVIRVGRQTRLCKGCTLFAAGLVAGIAAGFVVRPPFGWGACALLLALGAGFLSFCIRLPKFVGRFLPGAGLGLALCAGWPAATGSLLALAGLGLLYRRRGVARERCATCPEQSASPCSGFARIVRRERAFQRVANRWLRDLPRSVA
ncbi:MAG TPA: hypothetical protein VF524_06445, partial [Polyangia bacterium]